MLRATLRHLSFLNCSILLDFRAGAFAALPGHY
jgi:hypothetical protein